MRGAIGGEVGRVRAALSGALVAAGLTLVLSTPAAAFDARVGWRSVANAAGYRVYVRQAAQQFGSGIDVGLPPADGAGVVRYVASGLPLGVVHYFAARAYDANGLESALSNELSLLVSATPAPPTTTPTRSATPQFTGTRTPTAARTATRTPSRTAVPSGVGVSGSIRYYDDGAPVPDTTVVMQGLLGSAATDSDEQGAYTVTVPALGVWQLTPEKQGDLRGAVGSLDASYILQALSGSRTLNDIERLACDVTGNGALTSVDAARILQFTVGQIERFTAAQRCESDWLFLPQPRLLPAQALIQPLLGNGCRSGAIVFQPLLGSAAQQDFAAVPFGDCTGNWGDAAAHSSAPHTQDPTEVRLGAPRRRPGGIWLVPLHVEGREALDAIDAQIAFDPTTGELEDIELIGEPAGVLLRHYAEGGRIGLAVASTQSIPLGERPLAVLSFIGDDPPDVGLMSATVDGVQMP